MNILHVHNRSEMRQSVEIRMHNRRQPMEYTRAAGRSSFLIVAHHPEVEWSKIGHFGSLKLPLRLCK